MSLRRAIPSLPEVLVIGSVEARCREVGAALGRYLRCVPRVSVELPARVTAQLVVLVDPATPAASWGEFFAACGETPVLVMTQFFDDRRATEWILAGADDVIDGATGDDRTMGRAAVRVLARARRRAEQPPQPGPLAPRTSSTGTARLGSLIAFLQAAALTDPLTGLANRRALDDRLERAWADAVRDGTDLSVLMIDVDNFKGANDRYGHAHGDAVLVALAGAIRAQCRAADFSARYGGDEVVVLLPHTGVQHAQTVAERIREGFGARACSLAPGERSEAARAGLSIGIASRAGCDALTVQELLRCADQALYDAKRSGKGCTRVCEATREEAVEPATCGLSHLPSDASQGR